uniref:Uncharacterized protein n=1 Tax=Globodera pallida TaxID=36090 RepID=A0A183BPV3_GLOPA
MQNGAPCHLFIFVSTAEQKKTKQTQQLLHTLKRRSGNWQFNVRAVSMFNYLLGLLNAHINALLTLLM